MIGLPVADEGEAFLQRLVFLTVVRDQVNATERVVHWNIRIETKGRDVMELRYKSI